MSRAGEGGGCFSVTDAKADLGLWPNKALPWSCQDNLSALLPLKVTPGGQLSSCKPLPPMMAQTELS